MLMRGPGGAPLLEHEARGRSQPLDGGKCPENAVVRAGSRRGWPKAECSGRDGVKER